MRPSKSLGALICASCPVTYVRVWLIFFSAFIIGSQGYCQDSVSVKDVEKKLDRLNDYLKIFEERIKSEETSEDIGTLILFATKVKYTKSTSKRRSKGPSSTNEKDKNSGVESDEAQIDGLKRSSNDINIKTIFFNIKDGAIIDIQIITYDDKTFTNYHSPLNLNLFNESGHYATYLNKEGEIERIYLNHFLRWQRKRGYNPADCDFELKEKGDSIILKRGVGINHVIDLNLFTDLPALFGDKPNGVTQTEAYARIITHTGSIKKFSYIFLRTPIIPFKFFSVKAVFSKFDSKYETTLLDDNFSRQELLQKSNIQVDLTTNIISTWIPRKSANWFNLNAGGGFYSSNLSKKADTTNVLLPYLYIDPVFELRGSQNFGIDVSFRLMFQQAPQVLDYEGWHTIFRPQVTLFWNPANTPSNRIFSRIVMYRDHKQQDDPFYQVQIGYALRISEIIKPQSKKP